MYMTMKMLASKYGCSKSTIERRVREMERSGMYPAAIRRVCGVQISAEDFEKFCTIGRRKVSDET